MPGIVVGVDGSSHSRKALEAARVKRRSTTRRSPCSPCTRPSATCTAAPPTTRRRRPDQQGQGGGPGGNRPGAGHARLQPASVTVIAVHGLPVDELIKASQGADMLVLGRRGAGGFARLMMGSVTDQVSRHAHSRSSSCRRPSRDIQRAEWAPVIMAARSSDAGRMGAAAAPGEEPARPLQILRRPQLVVDDAVHVAVVLGEVARRVLQVPEEVRARVVPSQTPHVAFRPALEHGLSAAADVVHVVDLPGRMVQEAHRRG